jgi:hypothetical protein
MLNEAQERQKINGQPVKVWTLKFEHKPKYNQLVNFKTDEYVYKATKTLGENMQLIEAGFEYITDIDNIKLFRKRK